MKTLADALVIRRRVFGAFEMAQTATDPAERRRWLTFALVGAGPTGVELAGQIRELATLTLRDEFRRLDPEEARVLLFDAGTHAARPVRAEALGQGGDVADQDGRRDAHGLDASPTSTRTAWSSGTRTASSTRYEAGNVLWTAGVAAPPLAGMLAKATGAEQDRAGRILVQPDLTIPGTRRSRWSAT